MLRAYCPNPTAVIPFSLAKVTFQLGFEDVQECGQFFAMHGIR